jgi:hypothetical protein
MGLLGKRKVERPKSTLGLALYQYDNIVDKDLKKILGRINAEKKLNAEKTGRTLENIFKKLDEILSGLSREKLKVDYRSDKIRYNIIEMINKLGDFLEKAKAYDFDPSRIKNSRDFPSMDEIMEIRSIIRKRMKDIESDYS